MHRLATILHNVTDDRRADATP